MQHLDNDMDELFQRAAADYPLAPGMSNWNNIQQKLSEANNEEISSSARQYHYKKNILITLILLLSLGQFYTVHYKPGAHLQPLFQGENNTAVAATDGYKTNRVVAATVSTVNHKQVSLPVAEKQSSPAELYLQKNTAAGESELPSFNNVVEKNDDAIEIQQPLNGNDILANWPISKPLHSSSPIDLGKLSLTGTSSAPAPIAKNGGSKNDKVSLNKATGFYAGVSAGLDFSKGISMGFGNTGFTGGILIGYQFSNSLAVETGISRGTKNYDSRGSDFDMSKVKAGMPSGMTINSLNSSSTIIEIPLKVKVDIYKHSKSGLFITGGVSSYILTREFNRYNASVNGQTEKITGMYKTNSYEVPAAAIFSAGYQTAVSPKSTIRIEPFLKIPLQGIGVGNLPVTTAGFQLAFVTRLK